MTIDLWFPTVIYHEDLKPTQHTKDRMIEYFDSIHHETDIKDGRYSGDIHQNYQLFNDSRFHWLNTEVSFHCKKFLSAFNVDVDKISIYASKAWPVIIKQGGDIFRHTHPNSVLSVVYYPQSSNPLNGGKLKFHSPNPRHMPVHPEELNDLTYSDTLYVPEEGRLFIFPSHIEHEVEKYHGMTPRYSISYDIIVTSSNSKHNNEFAIIDPYTWKNIDPVNTNAI